MDKKAEVKNAQDDETNELICEACTLEGCDEGMHCFGVAPKGLCVEAIAQYNELRKKELLAGRANKK